MQHATVVLKCHKGEFSCHTHLPSLYAVLDEGYRNLMGVKIQRDGKLTFEFKKRKDAEGNELYNGDYVCEVPTVIEYLDEFKHNQEFHRNYAQFLIDAYNKKDSYGDVVDMMFSVVKINKPQIIEKPLVKEAPVSKRKGKIKHEEAAV